jgi:outer membrane receptor protein involved in Fe transport
MKGISVEVVRTVVLLVMFILAQDMVKGEDATGKIEGTLRDPQAAVVPNASVTVTNLGTSVQKSAQSDKIGNFAMVLLPIGQYRLTVEAKNFSRYVREPITLNVNDTIHLLIDLKLGSPQETVQVSSDAPLVETVSNALGKVTSGREILDLPLNGRNFSQLGILQAGAAPLTQGLAEAGGTLRAGQAYSINGLRPESNDFLIDGAHNINNVDSGFALKPPPDAIAEFRIITGGAAAEFGGNLGSNTNLAIKSGNNELHGSAYEFFRNDVFDDARNFFSQEVEPLKQNQFGATVGGPLKKNRTFFFGFYEGFRNRQGVTRTAAVPTALERQGDFSRSVDASGQVPPLINYLFGQPIPGNVIPPEMINSVSKNLLNFYPLPNAAPNLYTSTQVLHNNTDQFGARIDHQLSQRDEIFGRYLYSQGSSIDPLSISGANVPGFPVASDLRTQNFLLSETHTFSPVLINYARFAYFRNKIHFDERLNHTSPSSLGFNITPSYEPAAGPPFIITSGIASVGNPITGPRDTLQNSYELNDSISWIHGRHSLKFGGEYRKNLVDALQGIASNGFFVFAPFPISNPIANLLIGGPVVFFQAGGELPRGLRSHDLSLYAQDEYKVSSRFTLNLGLRYQINTSYTEINNRLAGFNPGQPSTVFSNAPLGLVYPGDAGVPEGLTSVYYKGLAPRFGLSWDPTGSGKMSVRAAYGINFEPVANGQGGILQAPISAPPYLQARQVEGIFLSAFGIPGFPTFADPFQGDTNPFPPGNFPKPLTHLTVQDNLRPPYIQNWNLSVQRQLGQKYLVEVRYVGTKGTRLPRFIEGNPSVYIPEPNAANNIDRRRIYANCPAGGGPCDLASVGLISGSTNSTYHAFQSTVSRTFSQGLFFSASYTLSKSLDYVSSLNETGSPPRNVSGENDLARTHSIGTPNTGLRCLMRAIAL